MKKKKKSNNAILIQKRVSQLVTLKSKSKIYQNIIAKGKDITNPNDIVNEFKSSKVFF